MRIEFERQNGNDDESIIVNPIDLSARDVAIIVNQINDACKLKNNDTVVLGYTTMFKSINGTVHIRCRIKVRVARKKFVETARFGVDIIRHPSFASISANWFLVLDIP